MKKTDAKTAQVTPKSAPTENHATKADGTPTVPNAPKEAEAKPAPHKQEPAEQSLAYEQGRIARAHGIAKEDAPYTADTDSLADWLKGYQYEQDNERG